MTLFQLITVTFAAVATIYYAPGLWREDRQINVLIALVWTTLVMAAIVSFVGIK